MSLTNPQPTPGASADHVSTWATRAAPQAGCSPTIALTYGTYDLFHIGHVRLFERIKQRYGKLIVAVSTDEFNAVKGKKSVVPFTDRVAMVRACRYVDGVIPETDWAQKESDVLANGVDAVVMGSDWTGRFDELKALCDVVYLPRTEGVSSTELKAEVVSRVQAKG